MEIQLLLTEQDIRVIVDGLGEMPLKAAGPVFTKIQQQLIAQPKDPVDEPIPTWNRA
jgi:hypothetical protein